MSQVWYTEIELDELVECSTTILAVEPMGFEHQKISIAPDGKEDSEKYPAFTKTVYDFKVMGILKNEFDREIPDAISVPEADWEEELGQHKLYYLEDIEESPEYEAYSPSINDIEKAGIVFLVENITNEGGIEFGFSMSFAYESITMKDIVKTIVHSGRSDY